MCSSSECQATSMGDLSNRGNKNDNNNGDRAAGGRRFLNIFLGWLQNIKLEVHWQWDFANITGYSVMKGLAMGMEPICCQAFGAKKWTVLSQTFRQTLCLLLLAAMPIILLWLNMEPILLSIGQDKTITSVAKVFLTYSIPDCLPKLSSIL
ncbi:hypothetical protein DITRI_Ditri18aG0004700 [Diplodiscus trichospermus]